MKRGTLAMLRCVAPSTDDTSRQFEVEHEVGQATVCGWALRLRSQRPRTALVCQKCGATYPLVDQIPQLLPPNSGESHYLHDEIIQTYYEAHYGSYITSTSALHARLGLSQGDRNRRAQDALRGDGPFDRRRPRQTRAGARLSAYYRSITYLLNERQLTEEFYQQMLDLCRPYVQNQTLVLDVGCGPGRMTAELARLGARLVVGLDRSPRMVAEAARILGATGPIPVALNLVGAGSVTATLQLPWTVKNYDLVVGDVEHLPLQDQAVDLITCLNLLDRVAHPAVMVGEFGRVLRPGGHLLIADPYHWDEKYTPRPEWVEDMVTLFDTPSWQRMQEVDGIPFVLRDYRRLVTVYISHCLIYRKR